MLDVYQINWKRIYKLELPKVEVVESLRDVYEYAPSDSVGAYVSGEVNTVYLRKGYEHNIGVLTHEYVHWFNARAYSFIDELWEVLWYVCGLRTICVGRRMRK